MPTRWVTHVAKYNGTAVATVKTSIAPVRPFRQWIALTCDTVTGVPMYVRCEYFAGATGIQFRLEPGDTIVFSRTGDMPFDGEITIQGVTGTCGYWGGEAYWEKVG